MVTKKDIFKKNPKKCAVTEYTYNRVLSTEYQAYLHAYLFIILYQRQFEIAVLVYYKNLWWPYIIVNTQVNQKKKKNQQKIHFLHIEKKHEF